MSMTSFATCLTLALLPSALALTNPCETTANYLPDPILQITCNITQDECTAALYNNCETEWDLDEGGCKMKVAPGCADTSAACLALGGDVDNVLKCSDYVSMLLPDLNNASMCDVPSASPEITQGFALKYIALNKGCCSDLKQNSMCGAATPLCSTAGAFEATRVPSLSCTISEQDCGRMNNTDCVAVWKAGANLCDIVMDGTCDEFADLKAGCTINNGTVTEIDSCIEILSADFGPIPNATSCNATVDYNERMEYAANTNGCCSDAMNCCEHPDSVECWGTAAPTAMNTTKAPTKKRAFSNAVTSTPMVAMVVVCVTAWFA